MKTIRSSTMQQQQEQTYDRQIVGFIAYKLYKENNLFRDFQYHLSLGSQDDSGSP